MRCGNDPRVVLSDTERDMVDWYRAWLAWMKTPQHERGQVPPAPAEVSTDGMIGYLRPWTPPVEIENGTQVCVKRACNGCGVWLGDLTADEAGRAVAGLPLDDVRADCPHCRHGVTHPTRKADQ